MGLVDYSDSDSEPEVQTKRPAKETKPGAKPFQKLVDRANPGKILVNLPTPAAGAAPSPEPSDEPPAKRARTTGGSRFSGFSSFLPPPKTTAAKPASAPSQNSAKPAPRPGVHLKTGAEPAFSREQASNDDYEEDGSSVGAGGGGGLKLPPPKNYSSGSANGPSIPEGQKPAEDVQLVGKPLMFKPLSVSRKPVKKKKTFPAAVQASGGATPQTPAEQIQPTPSPAPEPPKKKVSLFSLGGDTDTPTPTEHSTGTDAYEPLFSSASDPSSAPGPSAYDDDYSNPNYTHPSSIPSHQPPSAPSQPQSLSSIANDLNLSAQARRELFGRDGMPADAARVVNFDMSREYEHNEVIRQTGEGVSHNPVRSIKAGKHSLRQLVNAVQSNASALEESFASQKSKRSEAGARYGWR
ncbi:mitotic checkpoint regulator, MAD2B-interacting-domain-containing protein [Coniochaeta sp. 2T2.1]|nr:mitotic checkpoint regulator, MAD2B-interacting-domain-containing protein [Coniochaeta sp. 2T2.1]